MVASLFSEEGEKEEARLQMQREKKYCVELRKYASRLFTFFQCAGRLLLSFLKFNSMFNSPFCTNKSCTMKFPQSYLVWSLKFAENPRFSFCMVVFCISCRRLPVETLVERPCTSEQA